MTGLNLNANKVLKTVMVTVKVSGMNRARFRIWLGSKIARIGFWVIGTKCRVIYEGYGECIQKDKKTTELS